MTDGAGSLTYEQYVVTRLKGTEPAFSGRYSPGTLPGNVPLRLLWHRVVQCRAQVRSGTGWPSFWRPINEKAVGYAIDNSESEPRTEVMCRR